ncbi:hypothetical protein MPSEU_000598300 [Mayamaea pseudoterrestris]|nr:hypothetical protein MPSEU_000598300 [Mayamaea pseudoterrestris]
MTLSLSRLKSLLKEDEERKQREAQEKQQQSAGKQHQLALIRKAWQAHGIVSPRTGQFIRPISDSLFKCPLSQPQTTLVEWKSLSKQVQNKLLQRDPNLAQGNAVIEVPLTLLENTADSDLQKRQLTGNLSSKLSDYTRGVVGQSRPFTPGGLGQFDKEVAIDPYRTPDAIQRSMQVLEQGSEASWKDGTIITAPPGVFFKAGITWNDVHGSEKHDDDENDDIQDETTTAVGATRPESPLHVSSHNYRSERPMAAKLFSQSLLDDDSLFGSSSSDESEDENEEEDELNANDAAIDLEAEKAAVPLREELQPPADGAEDIDELLVELAQSTSPTHAKSSSKIATSMNPLELAARHAKDQNDSTRKSWATTKLLQINDFNSLIMNPAMTFPFSLDGFQQQAIARLERSESVFVAAHTSAGKTVVAEYAVALAMQRATRCVYTSPIKALSNQKFRDFSLKFGQTSIGLVTGDLQVNVDDSTCLIMTTEILRSMLYRGADLIRDIEFVIFDEVHYINDTERGVVWEEVIIMLPSYVNLIFLSATTPNTLEFADWVGRTKRKPIHVVKTDYRPVPLSHHLWAGLELHKIMEGKGGFIEAGYKAATRALLPPSAKDPKKKADPKAPKPHATGSKHLAWQAQGSKQNWMSLVRFLDRELLTPTVVFSFSQKKCEEIAQMLRSLDLNTAKERSAVQGFCLQAMARLSKNDASLPQVIAVCEMVERGIGIHHGGLLPLLKEVVEILFGKGLIKVLFATETFAMGVNMPARAVVFNSIRKHDGTKFRVLEPGEYTQMAGRAGRRGLDKVGTVIMCCFGEEPSPQQVLKQMLTGSSTLLSSQFRLTYNMILNLLRVEEMSVESMIARSFSEFATQRALTAKEYPRLLVRGTRTLEKLEAEFKKGAIDRVGLDDLEAYYNTCLQLTRANAEILDFVSMSAPELISDICCPGRIILVSAARKLECVRAPAIILKWNAFSAIGATSASPDAHENGPLVCLLLLPASFQLKDGKNIGKPLRLGYVGTCKERYYTTASIRMDQVLVVSAKKCKIDTKSLFVEDIGASASIAVSAPRSTAVANPFAGMKSTGRPSDPFASMTAIGKKKMDMGSSVSHRGTAKGDEELSKSMSCLIDSEKAEQGRDSGLPMLDLSSFVKRGADAVEIQQVCAHAKELLSQVRSNSSQYSPNLEKYFGELERKETLRAHVKTLEHLLSNESLSLFPDFMNKKSVLRKLGYIEQNETVSVKGRVACECNSTEELILTEMIFEGIIDELEPEEIAAVLSALVFQGRSTDEELDMELPENLVTCCNQMKQIATNLGLLQKEQGLKVDPGEYCDASMNFGLVHVIYEWALGVEFKQICALTDIKEGLIVRAITRLDELLREVRNCARVIGNPTLYRKVESASVAIKRDIVFASSLYVS